MEAEEKVTYRYCQAASHVCGMAHIPFLLQQFIYTTMFWNSSLIRLLLLVNIWSTLYIESVAIHYFRLQC